MNYILGIIYLILSSNQGVEKFIQALVIVLLLQLAWHMKKPLFMNLFRLLALLLSLYQINPEFYYVFIIYVLADLLFSTGEFYLPFTGIVLLGVYVYGVKSLDLHLLTLLGALFLLALMHRRGMMKEGKDEEEQRHLRGRILELEKELQSHERTKEQLKEYYILEERSRLSRELHDSVGHSLSTQLIQLKAITSLVKRDPERAEDMLLSLTDFTQQSMDKVREVLADLKPPRILGEDVAGAMMKLAKEFEERHGITVNLQISQHLGPVDEEARELLYRATREFLNNSLKHAKASRIDVILLRQDKRLQLTLKDNGVGCEEVKMNLGLRGLMELVFSQDGDMDISTAPGEGFILRIGVNLR